MRVLSTNSSSSARVLVSEGAMIIRPKVERMIKPSSNPIVRQRQAISFSLAKRLRVALSSTSNHGASSEFAVTALVEKYDLGLDLDAANALLSD